MNKNLQKQTTIRQLENQENIISYKNNKINFTKQFIRINKNQISFSRLSPQIKHILAYTLKQCKDRKVMKQVFYRWHDNFSVILQARVLYLKDEDGIQLIWRMQKILQRNKSFDIIKGVKNQINTLQQELNSYEKSLVNITEKKLQLTRMKFSKDRLQQKKQLSGKMNNFIAQIERKMIQLQQDIHKKRQEIESRQKKFLLNFKDPLINKILSKAIRKQVRNILRQSILFIVEFSRQIILEKDSQKEEVYVVFQQAYPTKKVKKTYLIKILGSQNYLEKVSKFQQFIDKREYLSQSKKQQINSMMCCHRCMKIQPISSLKFCRINITHVQTDSYPATDYFSFIKTHLEGDYFYDISSQHILPYFQYNKTKTNHICCNRAFCEDCINSFKSQGQKRFSCLYCKGHCNCFRCEKAVLIVKLIALDFKNDQQQNKHYHQMLNLFGNKKHSAVLQSLNLRQSCDKTELKFFEKNWAKCRQKFPKIKVHLNLPLKQQEQQIMIQQNGIQPQTNKFNTKQSWINNDNKNAQK